MVIVENELDITNNIPDAITSDKEKLAELKLAILKKQQKY